MKKIFTILLLAFCAAARAQQLSTVEYFFDTDPGVGHASQLTVSGASLDASLDLPLGNLSSGVHILNVRLKNSDGKWSTTYSSGVLIGLGTSGASAFTQAECYFDTDPGFGNGQHLTLSGSEIDDAFNFSVTGLASGPHTIYVRLKNNAGQWSTVYSSVFLLVAGSGGTTVFTQAEYYFDNDPGIGRGQQVSVNGASIDSLVNFSVSGLTSGVHMLYIRLKNSVNQWSYAYQGSFIVASGVAGIPMVKSVESFVGADSGVSRNAILPLSGSGSGSLDTTVSVFVPDNGGDSAILGLRLGNQTGQVGNVALASVNLCDLYKPRAAFRTARYGNTYSLISTTTYNPSNRLRWYVDGVLIDSSYTTNYSFPSGTIGTRRITLVAGSGCRIDSVSQNISIQGVEYAQPFTGSYGSDFQMTIYGGGLDTSMRVYLQKGDTVVYPYIKYMPDLNSMVAIFDFHMYTVVLRSGPNAGVGYQYDSYQLHVPFLNGYEPPSITTLLMASRPMTMCDGIVQVVGCPVKTEPTEPGFTTHITGSTGIRTGVWTNQTLTITNTGAELARSVPFYLMIPSNFDVDTSYWNIISNNPSLTDSMSIMVPVDTVINGVHLSYKLYALLCPSIRGGETISYPFRVRTTHASESQSVFTWANKRMFGSPFRIFWTPCVEEVVNNIAGFIPVVGCANATFDMTLGGAQKIIHQKRAPDAGSMIYSVAGTLISCVPGGALAEKLGLESFNIVKELADVGANNAKAAIYIADKQISAMQSLKNIFADGACGPKALTDWENADWTTRLGFDPNYISGSFSYDTIRHFTNNYSSQKYEIGFENKPTATAEAQHVMIIDTLDKEKFDLRSFRLMGFSIADSMYVLPEYRYSYTGDVSLSYRGDMKVRFTADFDTLTGVLHADLFSIDNNGRVFPPDSLGGFLPPDHDGVHGTGSIRYEISALPARTLEVFSNKAMIYFDNNDPIATNTWTNTVDTTAPKSSIVQALPVSDSTVKLIIQSSDIGSGIKMREIFSKVSGDSLFRNIGLTLADSILVTVDPQKTYQFFSRAIDNVNYQENKDSVADISYAATPLPVHLLNFTGVRDGARVKLLWTGVNEQGLARYEVERSSDGVVFDKIGSVPARGGTGNNSYVFYDESPLPHANYYRLKEVDNDGVVVYSRVVRVDFDKAFTIAISPVPAHDYIIIDGVENFRKVQLVDMSGRVAREFVVGNGNNFSVQGLASGMYFVRLVSETGSQTLKMIKQ